ncbi:MAG: ferritin-like domain-containing protein [Solirubrobacteraceae bacterium]
MSATRRDLLRGALAGGVAAGLGLEIGGGQALAAIAPLQGANTDEQVLFRLMEFEQLEIFAYGHVERTSVISAEARTTVSHFLSHERRHAEVLYAELKKHGVATPTPPSGVAEADRRLAALLVARRLDQARHEPAAVHLLIGVETVAETIYHLAIEKLTGALPELAARILGCEAQHWTGLSSLLHNGDPVLAVPSEFAPFATQPS